MLFAETDRKQTTIALSLDDILKTKVATDLYAHALQKSREVQSQWAKVDLLFLRDSSVCKISGP